MTIARHMGLCNRPPQTTLFILSYLSISLLAVGLWILNPAIGLIGFLVISCFHFSSDWKTDSNWLPPLSFSCFFISLPSITQPDLLSLIFQNLLLTQQQAQLITSALQYSFIGSLLLLIFTFIICKNRTGSFYTEVMLFILLSLTTSIYIYFLCYFCFLHSVHHLEKCSKTLKRNIFSSWTLSLPILFLTLFILSLFVLIFSLNVNSNILRIIFIGLFSLTVPHLILIDFYFSKKQEKIQSLLP